MKKADFSLSDADSQLSFLFLVFIVLLFVVGVLTYFSVTYDYALSGVLPSLEYKVHENILIKNCFSLVERRTYTSIIDSSKFIDERLQECLALDSTADLALQVSLYIIEDYNSITIYTENFGDRSRSHVQNFVYPVRVDINKTGILTVTYLK